MRRQLVSNAQQIKNSRGAGIVKTSPLLIYVVGYLANQWLAGRLIDWLVGYRPKLMKIDD
jgi:hypothetical protein